MSLVNTLASQDVLPQGVGAASKGLDAGLAYAQAQETARQNDEKLSMLKENHETQKTSYLLSGLEKVSQTEDKRLKKLYMEGLSKSYQQFYGKEMSKDIIDGIVNVPSASEGIKTLVKMYPDFATDVKAQAQFNADLATMMGLPLLDAGKITTQMIENHAKLKTAEKKGEMTDFQYANLELRKDNADKGQHRIAILALNNNKALNDRLGQFQNLKNSMSIITDAKKVGPQQIHEFQQSLRSNLGIKGTGGVDERDKTYFDSAELRFEDWKQFLNGTPADIAKNSEMMKHLIDISNAERKSISAGVDNMVDRLAAGNASMYKRRPDLWADLLEKIDLTKKMAKDQPVANPTNATDPAASPPPGTVNSGNDPESKIKALKVKTKGKAFNQLHPDVQKQVVGLKFDEKKYNELKWE